MLNGKSILITGGTGSFGKKFCEYAINHYKPARVIVYSRDEFKQGEMMKDKRFASSSMRYFLGDVRDRDRLTRAMNGVDIVVHAAALKQVPAAEYNPHEFIKTNINGAMNLVEAALDAKVKKVVALSTDKAVNPINLYGATKLCSDKIVIAANSYRGKDGTQFSVVRYGNVMGSRGSVIPVFIEQRKRGVITLTDPEMTRFYISLEKGVEFVIKSIERMSGGELYIPKLASCKLKDLAEAIAPDATHKIIGARPGEKKHEVLIPQDEAHLTLEFDDYYMLQPALAFWQQKKDLGGKPCKKGFEYASDNNKDLLDVDQLRAYCKPFEISEEGALVEC